MSKTYKTFLEWLNDQPEAVQKRMETVSGALAWDQALQHSEHVKQLEASHRIKMENAAEQQHPVSEPVAHEIPDGALDFTGDLHKIGMKLINYAKSQFDTNDISVAIWSAMREALNHQPTVQDGYVTVPRKLTRQHIGYIVDEVFDGALEDESVISDIWDAGVAAAKGGV